MILAVNLKKLALFIFVLLFFLVQANGSRLWAAGGLNTRASEQGPVIDLIVLYTQAARDNSGGTAKIENNINFAVLNTNAIYRNSGVYQRLRLVHTGFITFEESVFTSKDDVLDALEDKNDGFLDAAHDLRDTYGADLVMLVVDGYDAWSDWTGGQGTVLYENSISLSEYAAFTLVDWKHLLKGTAFPHELGHNMGLRHDWYRDGGLTAPYSYAYGYTNPESGWRTIMAYEDKCDAMGLECPRILFFSNPDLLYNGEPIGVAQGTGTNCQAGNLNNPLCDSDARMTLNNTAATVAAFRDALMDESFGKVAHLSPDGIVNTYEPEFSWEPALGAEKYRLLVGTAWENGTEEGLLDGNTIVSDKWFDAQDICTSDVCSASIDFHFSDGNHYWSVQAYKADGYGLWTDPTDFALFSTSMSGSSPLVTPTAPSDAITGSLPTFFWEPALGNSTGTPDPTHYRILVWDRGASETVYWTSWYEAESVCTSTACSVKPSEPTLPDGNYLWRIKSKSAYGEGEYDTRLYFEVDSSVSSDVCGASENLLEIGGSYYVLTLPEFCLGGSAYVGDTGIRLGFDGRWNLETILNGKDTWVVSGSCRSGGNNLVPDTSSYLLTIPGYCLNGNSQAMPLTIRLHFDGTWELSL